MTIAVFRGDVVLVDYPYTDRTGSKVRPCILPISRSTERSGEANTAWDSVPVFRSVPSCGSAPLRSSFRNAEFSGSNIIVKFKSPLPPEWLHSFSCRDWFDRLPCPISRLLHAKPTGFVKLAQPGDHSLPRTIRLAMRFHQRPVSMPLSIFRSAALANKHDRER